jgi:hypothetical protein
MSKQLNSLTRFFRRARLELLQVYARTQLADATESGRNLTMARRLSRLAEGSGKLASKEKRQQAEICSFLRPESLTEMFEAVFHGTQTTEFPIRCFAGRPCPRRAEIAPSNVKAGSRKAYDAGNRESQQDIRISGAYSKQL